tara:strand:- start:519 stop:941 length:423 start_codon:yes stop_codon:yes gene_type:complete
MVEILEQKENFLTNRKEIKIIVEAEKNPTYEEASKIITEEFKADSELVIVKKIKGKFGTNTFLISCFIYNSKEDKENFEKKKEKKKDGEKQEEGATQTPAQTEQKPEEKKEDNTPTKDATPDSNDSKDIGNNKPAEEKLI